MADKIDARPQEVDISLYAGDTFTLAITAPPELTDGKDWLAQVRLTNDAATVDATWLVQEPDGLGGPGYITLTSDMTRDLANMGVMRTKAGRSFLRYSGVWDCQLSLAGTDPVTTLGRGTIEVDLDVSRIEP